MLQAFEIGCMDPAIASLKSFNTSLLLLVSVSAAEWSRDAGAGWAVGRGVGQVAEWMQGGPMSAGWGAGLPSWVSA